MKRGKNQFIYYLFAIFAMVGVGLLVGGFFSVKSTNRFLESAVSVQGKISNIESYRNKNGERCHCVYVNFDLEGRVYRDIALAEYSSDMYEGEAIVLLCDPNNPEDVRSKSTIYLLSIILISMGTIFFFMGFIPTVIIVKRNIQTKRLFETGYTLQATIESIGENRSIRVNGKHPYQVYCTYKDPVSGVIYRFKNCNIWTNPSGVLFEGGPVTVYVDANDYSKHYVAVEEILEDKIVDFT